MAPDSSEQKRKRGRPAGAPKLLRDASNRNAPDDNDADDAEDESRPRKRGRKATRTIIASSSLNEAQEGLVQKRDQLSKAQEKQQAGKSKNALEHKRTTKKPSVTSKETIESAKGTGKQESAADDAVNSQPRRSGRERRAWNPEDVYGAKQAKTSQDDHNPPELRHKRSSQRVGNGPASSTSRRREGGRNQDDVSSSAGPVVQKKRSNAQLTDKTKTQKQTKGTQQRMKVPEQEASSSQGAGGKKRPGRPSLKRQDDEQDLAQRRGTKVGKDRTKPQASFQDGSQDGPPLRRGRPKTSAPSAEEPDAGEPSGSRAPLREGSSNIIKKPKQRREASPKPQRNESVSDGAASESSEEEFEFPFRHLKDETRNVSQSTIASKWNRLDMPSINTVSSFLADAQRSVLFRLQDTNRQREHASAAMNVVSRRLRARLIKGFPFPAPIAGASSRIHPKGYEDEFDFERLVDTMQNLESTLNPLSHSIGLLEREIKKQEDALAKDYNSLHDLEHNARSKTREWREKAKREHSLAPGVKKRDQGLHRGLDGQVELMSPVKNGAHDGSLFTGFQDEDLVGLTKQIGNHMESLRGNLQQIGGVVPAITRSKAALQQVLLKHLDEEQYGRILLG